MLCNPIVSPLLRYNGKLTWALGLKSVPKDVCKVIVAEEPLLFTWLTEIGTWRILVLTI